MVAIGVGVGVGVPLIIMVLGGFGFLVWRERRRRPAHKIVHGDLLPKPIPQENNASSDGRRHEIDGNIALADLPIQRESWR